MKNGYPFGMAMPARDYSASSYRYGFNGKERDKDLHSLTAYDYGFRIYNPGIGKFLSVDPIADEYPDLTPYQFASNSPIDGIDLDGKEHEHYILSWSDKSKAAQITLTSIGPKTKKVFFNLFTVSMDHIAYVSYPGGAFGNRSFRFIGKQEIQSFRDWAANPQAYKNEDGSVMDFEQVFTSEAAEYLRDVNYALAEGAGMRQAVPLRGTAKPAGVATETSTSSTKPAVQQAVATDVQYVNTTATNTTQSITTSSNTIQRPTPVQSEKQLTPTGPGEVSQPKFKSGTMIMGNTRGHVKPESYNFFTGVATEVKNFTFKPNGVNVKSINTLVKQIIQRQSHLPAGSTQHVIVDIRGQNVPLMQQYHFRNQVMSQTRTPGVNITFQTQ